MQHAWRAEEPQPWMKQKNSQLPGALALDLLLCGKLAPSSSLVSSSRWWVGSRRERRAFCMRRFTEIEESSPSCTLSGDQWSHNGKPFTGRRVVHCVLISGTAPTKNTSLYVFKSQRKHRLALLHAIIMPTLAHSQNFPLSQIFWRKLGYHH